MSDSIKQKAVTEALILRFEKQRLPRLLEIKKNVDAGNPLSKMDSEFLEELLHDAQDNKHYAAESPEDIQVLFTKVIQLYKDIIATALQIEQK